MTTEISGDVTIGNTVTTEISGDVTIGNIVTTEVSGDVTIGNTVTAEISGDVTIGNTVTTEISGDVTIGNTVTTEISGDVTIGNTVTTEISGTPKVALDEYNDDAFGRLRVSNPYTLYDYTSVFGKDPLKIDEEISGDASATHFPESFIEMSVGAENGARVVRQSREYIPYQPGKSKLIYLTGVLIQTRGSDVDTKIGVFDDHGGLYFEYNETDTINIVKRENTTETKISKSNWVDSLDGTGSSGLNIDFEKANLFFFDQEWLGVGRVRIGLVLNGKHVVCHVFDHINELVKPYFPTAKLPIRYEIQSKGGAGKMRMICGSVMSEGGFNNIGNTFSTKEPIGMRVDLADEERPLISLRLRDTSNGIIHKNASIKIKTIDVLNTELTGILGWKLIWNPTLTLSGTNFTPYETEYSSAELCIHNQSESFIGTTEDTVSGGIVLASGYGSQRANVVTTSTVDELQSSIGIGRSISGVSDVITLTVQALTDNNTDCFASLGWVEIR